VKKKRTARSHLLTVRLHSHEMQALFSLAKDEGAKNLSDFVRRLPDNFFKNSKQNTSQAA